MGKRQPCLLRQPSHVETPTKVVFGKRKVEKGLSRHLLWENVGFLIFVDVVGERRIYTHDSQVVGQAWGLGEGS